MEKIKDIVHNEIEIIRLSIYSNISLCYKNSEIIGPAIVYCSKIIDALDTKMDKP